VLKKTNFGWMFAFKKRKGRKDKDGTFKCKKKKKYKNEIFKRFYIDN